MRIVITLYFVSRAMIATVFILVKVNKNFARDSTNMAMQSKNVMIKMH